MSLGDLAGVHPAAPEKPLVAYANPYHVEKHGKDYVVMASKTGRVVKNHGPDRMKAMRHVTALEAAMHDAPDADGHSDMDADD